MVVDDASCHTRSHTFLLLRLSTLPPLTTHPQVPTDSQGRPVLPTKLPPGPINTETADGNNELMTHHLTTTDRGQRARRGRRLLGEGEIKREGESTSSTTGSSSSGRSSNNSSSSSSSSTTKNDSPFPPTSSTTTTSTSTTTTTISSPNPSQRPSSAPLSGQKKTLVIPLVHQLPGYDKTAHAKQFDIYKKFVPFLHAHCSPPGKTNIKR